MEKFFCYYILLMNVLAYLAMKEDKKRARKDQWRISEKTLFLLSLAGGSLGSLAGMYHFHHKTKKWYFQIGMPLILLIHLLLLWKIIGSIG